MDAALPPRFTARHPVPFHIRLLEHQTETRPPQIRAQHSIHYFERPLKSHLFDSRVIEEILHIDSSLCRTAGVCVDRRRSVGRKRHTLACATSTAPASIIRRKYQAS